MGLHTVLVLCLMLSKLHLRYIDMAESLCQKRALEAFQLDPAKWGGEHMLRRVIALFTFLIYSITVWNWFNQF